MATRKDKARRQELRHVDRMWISIVSAPIILLGLAIWLTWDFPGHVAAWNTDSGPFRWIAAAIALPAAGLGALLFRRRGKLVCVLTATASGLALSAFALLSVPTTMNYLAQAEPSGQRVVEALVLEKTQEQRRRRRVRYAVHDLHIETPGEDPAVRRIRVDPAVYAALQKGDKIRVVLRRGHIGWTAIERVEKVDGEGE